MGFNSGFKGLNTKVNLIKQNSLLHTSFSLHPQDCVSSERCGFELKQAGNLQLVAHNCSLNTYWKVTALRLSRNLNGLLQYYTAEYRPQNTRWSPPGRMCLVLCAGLLAIVGGRGGGHCTTIGRKDIHIYYYVQTENIKHFE